MVDHYHSAHRDVPVIRNGTRGKAPSVGDVMSFSGDSGNDAGHVAIVTDVYHGRSKRPGLDSKGNGSVMIVGQNQNGTNSSGFTAGGREMSRSKVENP